MIDYINYYMTINFITIYINNYHLIDSVLIDCISARSSKQTSTLCQSYKQVGTLKNILLI